jgi:hypothetical protein
MTTPASVYLEVSVPCVDRLLGLLDRNPLSSTYGCFDRNYWHYKTTDFSNGRQQEAALTLALLYTESHPSNPYYNQKKIKEWSLAAMRFLKTIQNADGSYNEYYPHEHAFVTTAFATFAVSEGLLILKERPPDIIEVLSKSGTFLMKKEELQVVNQNLGAAAALQNLYILTGNEEFQKGARAKMESSLQRQSPEGWFYEYGGPDIGYLSVAISYLAHYCKKTNEKSVISRLKAAVRFLSYFLHPDGTAGGEYGSRNTTYIEPDGVEICAQYDAEASYFASRLRKSFHQKGFTPLHLDDRYLCNMLYSYVYAFRECKPLPPQPLPESHFFSESGLLVEKAETYLLIANLRKGGVFTVFSDGTLTASDSGFLGRLSDGRMVSSQWLGTAFTQKESDCIVRGHLVVVPEQQMTPLKAMIMRAFLSAGRHYASDLVKQYLRKRLITQKSRVPVSFQRKITLGKNICVKDVIEGDVTFASLHIVDHASLVYIPSSRYFKGNELITPVSVTGDLSEEFNKKKKIVHERDIVTCGDISLLL